MKNIAALIVILGLLFSVVVLAEERPQEVHIEGWDTVIVGMFEIWKHSDGTWQDTDYDGIRDRPYNLDPRSVTAQLQAPIPEEILTKYDNVRTEIIPMSWEGDATGENKDLFEKDQDGYSAIIKDDMGLIVEAFTYDEFNYYILQKRPKEYKVLGDENGKVKLILESNPTQTLKRTWQGEQVEGYGFYLPALVQYYGVPKTLDIEASRIESSNPILVNTPQVSTAVFMNNGNKKTSFIAKYYAGGVLIKEENLEIEAQQTIERNFSWTSSNNAGAYCLKIHAVPLPEEKNVENNTKETNVTVESFEYVKPDCVFTNKLTSNWNEIYSWMVYHSDTCTDEDGKEHDCSWTEIVNQSVSYSESLSAFITINTKQGIPTSREYPEEANRESRGSWEIIPWAARMGIDPNSVTRAGYGFEIKVQTTYWTDWETKVPGPAISHGGKYKGPVKVVAQFYNTLGYFVEQRDLEPTKGNAGDKNIIWELPIIDHTYSDGQTIFERKYYTDIRNKDGKYGVRIIIFDCGRKSLSICVDKYVTIYGDMYDDIYTRSATSAEFK